MESLNNTIGTDADISYMVLEQNITNWLLREQTGEENNHNVLDLVVEDDGILKITVHIGKDVFECDNNENWS